MDKQRCTPMRIVSHVGNPGREIVAGTRGIPHNDHPMSIHGACLTCQCQVFPSKYRHYRKRREV